MHRHPLVSQAVFILWVDCVLLVPLGDQSWFSWVHTWVHDGIPERLHFAHRPNGSTDSLQLTVALTFFWALSSYWSLSAPYDASWRPDIVSPFTLIIHRASGDLYLYSLSMHWQDILRLVSIPKGCLYMFQPATDIPHVTDSFDPVQLSTGGWRQKASDWREDAIEPSQSRWNTLLVPVKKSRKIQWCVDFPVAEQGHRERCGADQIKSRQPGKAQAVLLLFHP